MKMSEMEEKAKVEKALHSEMVTVQVQLFKPFYDFIKAYAQFFGSKHSVEDVCRQMIYESANILYSDLRNFQDTGFKFIEKDAWMNKWPHLSITSSPTEEPQVTVYLDRKVVEEAEKLGIDVENAIREHLMRLKEKHHNQQT